MGQSKKLAVDYGAAGACNGSAHPSEELNHKGIYMKHTRGLCLLGLLSLFGFASVQAQQATGGTEKAIVALENQWLKSQQTNNADLTAPLLADKYVFTSEDGKVMNKASADRRGSVSAWKPTLRGLVAGCGCCRHPAVGCAFRNPTAAPCHLAQRALCRG